MHSRTLAQATVARQAESSLAHAVGGRLSIYQRVVSGAVSGRMAFIDHVTLPVRDLETSRRFYELALRPFGIRVVESSQGPIGFGPTGGEDFWIKAGEPAAPVHVAFLAPDRATVDAFHKAALGAGGQDNGAPELRPQYEADYYAAYVIDPDGNNVEAVFHDGSAS